MDDNTDSGYPSARDALPNTSTPIRPTDNSHMPRHFPLHLNITGDDANTSTTSNHHAESKASRTKADEGIRNAITAEREVNENRRVAANIKFELEVEKGKAEAAEKALRDKEKELTEVNIQNALLKTMLSNKEGLCNTLEEQNRALHDDVNMLKEQLEQTNARMNEAKNECVSKQKRLDSLMKEEATLNDELKMAQQNEDERQKNIYHMKQLAQENNELKVQLTTHSEQIQILRVRVNDLQAERDSFQEDQRRLEEKQKTSHVLEMSLRNQLADLQKKLDSANIKESELNTANVDLQQQLDKFQSDFASLNQTCHLLEDQIKLYKTEVSNMEDKLVSQEILQKQLAEEREKILQLEKQCSQLLADKKESELELISAKRKMTDLESVNGLYASKDLAVSSKLCTLQQDLSSKQRQYQQLEEEYLFNKQRLEEAEQKAKHFEESMIKDSQNQKNFAELQKVNQKLTVEIDYLRAEISQRLTKKEALQKEEKLRLLTDELSLKQQQLEKAEKRCEDLETTGAATNKSLQQEIDIKSEKIKDNELQIAHLKSTIEAIRVELNEKCDSTAKLIEEFEKFKHLKDDEIKHYVAKLNEADANYTALHTQLQHEVQRRSLRKVSNGSALWDHITEEIRCKIPTDLEEVFKNTIMTSAMRDPTSASVSQNDIIKKLVNSMEKHYTQKLPGNNMIYNILQLITKLLQEQHPDIEISISSFFADMTQLLEKRERTFLNQISGLEKIKCEESKARREYHDKARDLELKLDRTKDENKEAVRNLEQQLTKLTTDFNIKLNTLEIRDATIHSLRIELEELRNARNELAEKIKENEKAIRCSIEFCKELQMDSDKWHDEEDRLHERIRDAEEEAESLKRHNTKIETEFHALDLEKDILKKKLEESRLKVQRGAQDLEEYRKKLAHEERTKRYNQDTMRICFEHMDRYQEAVDHLQRKNMERQKVIDKITKDIESFSSPQALDAHKKYIKEKCSKWKKDDDDLNTHVQELCLSHNQMLRARSTSDLNAAFKEAQANRRITDKNKNDKR